jgi:long-chain fatty acid transport protein
MTIDLRRAARTATLAAAALAASNAGATNGYFSHGYGVKAQGMTGVGIALAQDGLAAATNPAGITALGNRADLGLTWFRPNRGAEIVGNAFGADADYGGNGTSNFFIPEFGYTRRLSDSLSVGLAVYGNGGMNTDYPVNPYSRFGATGSAGAGELSAFVIVAPRKTVNGSGSIPPGMPSAGGLGGGEANVRLGETAFGIAYGWKF